MDADPRIVTLTRRTPEEEYQWLRMKCAELTTENRDLAAKCREQAGRLMNLHAAHCSAENCVLDGGPEHEAAFARALLTTRGEEPK